MEKSKKVFPFVLAAALATSPFLNVPKAFAVSDLSVKADDTYKAGDDSDYTLEFTIDEDLDSGDTITIEFDSDFDIDSKIDESDIRVNGKEPDSVDYSSSDNSIDIEVPRDYNNDTEMKVTIKNAITNPDDDGEYDVTVYAENDDDEDTDTVKITKNGSGSQDDFPVTIGDYDEGARTDYTIGEISLDSSLSEGEWITVTFPNADMLPGGIDKKNITINGYNPTSVKISEKTVKLKVPRGVEGDDTLTLRFNETASINNPTARTNYSISVEYDGDTYKSDAFSIQKGSGSATSIPVSLSNALTGANSSYTFNADFGKSRLRPYGILTVEFPDEDMLPSRISTSDIKLNGKAAKKVTVSGKKVTITAPSSMYADNDVKVEFTSAADITNPQTSGSYRVKMSVTGKSLTSDSFTIYSSNGVTATQQ